MARLTPLWMQAGEYPAEVDRQLLGVFSGGVVGLAMQVLGNTRNVLIGAGKCAVPLADGGAYLCAQTTGEEVPIPTASAQDRIDLIVARPREPTLDFIFDVIAGNAAASPVPPLTPAGTLALAQVRVVTGQAFLVAANLTDIRPKETGSELAFATTANGQTNIQTTPVDLNGLTTPPFTLQRRRRIELFANIGMNKAASDQAQWNLVVISNMANVNQASAYQFLTAPGWAMVTLATSLTLEPGTYQFKCRAQTASGFLNVTAGSTSMIRARDLGPA